MVYDCFTFFDELDLLEFRLRHLWDIVDIFIICESTHSFAGKPKPLYFADNISKYTWALGKIRHYVCDDMILNATHRERWVNEAAQRNYLASGLFDAQPGDTVIIGDVDELPAVDAAVAAVEANSTNFVCLMDGYCYFVDRRIENFTWHGSCMVKYDSKFSPQDIRNKRTSGQYEAIPEAGWHFSYLGGIEAIQRKLSSFSHAEFDTPELRDAQRLLRDMTEDRIFLDGIPLKPVDDFELPHVMHNGRQTHPQLFHPVDRRRTPLVYDCFMFWKELHLLELRLRTLYDHVDRFVIVEAPFTFTGQPKPLYFWENRQSFAWALSKIEHVLVDFEPRNSAWWNESAQRNNIMNGLGHALPGDLIMISDVDEIPRPEAITRAAHIIQTNDEAVTLTLNKCYYKFNNFMTGHEDWAEPHPPWNMFIMCRRKHLDKRKPQVMRDAHNAMPTISDAGWHFSFMGSADIISEKINAFSHTEYNTPEIIEQLEDKVVNLTKDVFNRGYTFEVRPVERGILPDYIIDHVDYYQELGLIA